jgi:branched-chain amino acid transport system permease protein
MTEFAQQVVNGISTGSVYALIAVGLTLVFGVARVGNFAHGDFVMVAAYVVILSVTAGVPLLAAAAAAIGIAVTLAVTAELVVFRRLAAGPATAPFVAAIGLSIVIQAAVIILVNGTPRNMPPSISLPPLQIGDVILTAQRAITIIGSIAAMIALGAFLAGGRYGKAIRALAQHPDAARMVGIPSATVRVVTMVVAGALAGWAAVLLAPIYGAQPTIATLLTLKAFAIVIFAGLGSVRGALIGAYVLGVAEALFAGYVSSDYQNTIAFALLAFVLIVRPGGLFGEGTVAMELRR